MSLRPCVLCSRHIRVTARACPFCQPTLAAAIAIGLAFAACGGKAATPPPTASDARPTDARPARGDIYGVPPAREFDARPAPLPDAAAADARREPAAPIYGVPEHLAPPQVAPTPKPPRSEDPPMQPMYGVPREPGD